MWLHSQNKILHKKFAYHISTVGLGFCSKTNHRGLQCLHKDRSVLESTLLEIDVWSKRSFSLISILMIALRKAKTSNVLANTHKANM